MALSNTCHASTFLYTVGVSKMRQDACPLVSFVELIYGLEILDNHTWYGAFSWLWYIGVALYISH